jgi:hypothetical protein
MMFVFRVSNYSNRDVKDIISEGNGENMKSKAIPVTVRGSLFGCEMLRIPHCLDSRLTDGGKLVSPTHRPRSTP